MMKHGMLTLVLSTVAFGALPTTTAHADELAAVSEECGLQEEEKQRLPRTDPGVVRIIRVTHCGIYWHEAEDAQGNRHVITQVTHGSASQGYVDFGDGQGGRYVEWR